MAEDATATVRINGGAPVLPGDASAPLALAPGHNAFTLQITRSDGQLNRSYTLDVLRGQGNAALAGLSLSDGSLTPAFDPGATAYSATVPYVVTTLRVGVALADPEASAHVAGRALRSGHAAAVALAPGANSVPVQVTSSDGTVQRSYMLTITRAAPVQALGDHPAQFAAAQTLQLAGGTVRALAAQDMDGDGRPDLLALEAPRPELALLTAQDGGGFGPVQWLPLGVVIPAALAPGGYLGQGWTDVLAPIGGEARLALNLGAGHMLAHPAIVDGYYEPLVAHDMDGDGRDDVAARSGSNAVLLHSLGDGRFAPPQVAGSLPGLRFVAAGDFDGDGHADLALISDQGAVRVLPGLPQGGFGTPWDGSLGVAGISGMVAPPRVADLDGDGRDDLAVAVSANGLSTLAVLRGQPGGRRRGQLHARPGAVRRQRCLHRHACHGLPVHGLDGRLRGPGRRLHPGQCPGGAGFGGAVRAPCLRRHGHGQPGGGRHGELRTQPGGAWRQRHLYRHGQRGLPVRGLDGRLCGPGRPLHPGGLTEEKASAALFAQQTTLALPEGPQAQKPLGLALQAGAGWQVAVAGTQTAASVGAALPAGVTLPHGVVRLRLERGSQATVVLTYPQALPQGAVYYKYGKTADGPQPHWYPFPGAAISGSTVTLTLQDGGAGDDDRMENSVIVDPGGVALLAAAPAGAQAIPTLGGWALALLAGLLGLFSLGAWRRR